MVRRLLYFTKNATAVDDSSRNWQVCLSTSNICGQVVFSG